MYNILTGQFFPLKFRKQNFNKMHVKRSTGISREENENFEHGNVSIRNSETETTVKNQNMCLYIRT
jgi:hypothetical protein